MSLSTPIFKIKSILRYGPGVLIISAAALLVLQAILVSKYYSDMFPAHIWSSDWRTKLAALGSVSLKALAFGLLFMTVKDFSDGRSRPGKWGLSATFFLNSYFLFECHSMASLWDAGGNYWHIFPFLAVLTIMVVFVEWRLAISVNSQAKEESYATLAESTIATLRQLLDTATGKVEAYEAAMRAEEHRKQEEIERLRTLEAAEAERRKQEEYDTLKKELAAARRQLTMTENTPAGKATINPEAVLRVAKDYMRKNPGLRINQSTAAALLKKTERTIRNAFPNGSWDKEIENLFREINQTQPEETTV